MNSQTKHSTIPELSFLSDSDSSPKTTSGSSSPVISQFLSYKQNCRKMKEGIKSESEFDIYIISESTEEVDQSKEVNNSSSYLNRFNSSWIRII